MTERVAAVREALNSETELGFHGHHNLGMGIANSLVAIEAGINSVSLDPPLALWSLACKSQSLAAFEITSHWTVHIQAHDQSELSGNFARSISGAEKFADITVEEGLGATPLLSGCTSRTQCRTVNIYDGGAHIILIGEVLQFEKCDTPPLVFQSGHDAIATSTAQKILPPEGEDPRNVSDIQPARLSTGQCLSAFLCQVSGKGLSTGAQ